MNFLNHHLAFRIWLWNFIAGVAVIIVTFYILYFVFHNNPNSNNIAISLLAVIIMLAAMNIANYLSALLIGLRYVRSQRYNTASYLKWGIPLSILAFISSAVVILAPLALFSSIIATWIVVFAIRKSSTRVH